MMIHLSRPIIYGKMRLAITGLTLHMLLISMRNTCWCLLALYSYVELPRQSMERLEEQVDAQIL